MERNREAANRYIVGVADMLLDATVYLQEQGVLNTKEAEQIDDVRKMIRSKIL